MTGGEGGQTESEEKVVILRNVKSQLYYAQWILGSFQLLFIIIFGAAGGSDQMNPEIFASGHAYTVATPNGGTENIYIPTTTPVDGYNFYVGVMIMMLVGFGYLMTFMKWYGLGAVGFSLLVSAVGLQWGLLMEAFFNQMYHKSWGPVSLDIYAILAVTSNIAAPLISLGAVIGKATPLQILIMVMIEFPCHAFNFNIILTGILKVVDIGGTYCDHMFGCYYGLAIAYVLGRPTVEPAGGHTPDIFSLIGTAFLWVYWPSFVGGYAEAGSMEQQRAIVNTIFCLCASTVMAFWGSSFFNKATFKFRAVDIQNATLAGGVAIGCIANLPMSPAGALMVGSLCGILSTFGYSRIQPFLLEKFGLHDTCGIHNLHGMPSVFGAMISVFLAGRTNKGSATVYTASASVQATYQFFGILLCLGFAIASGTITGIIMRKCGVTSLDTTHKKFHDAEWWEGVGGVTAAAIEAGEEDNVNVASPLHHLDPFGLSSHGRKTNQQAQQQHQKIQELNTAGNGSGNAVANTDSTSAENDTTNLL